MENEKCCGTCRYHRAVKAGRNGEWICNNEDSDGFGLETAYDDECGEWEER